MDGYAEALSGAVIGTTRLWRDVRPVPTNLWAVSELETLFPGTDSEQYLPKRQADNGVLSGWVQNFVDGLTKGSTRHWIEQDYADKFQRFRNWYLEHGLIRTGQVAPWFHWGNGTIPKGFYDYLLMFWRKVLTTGYKPVAVDVLKCPDNQASTGFAYVNEGWIFQSEAGPVWEALVEASPAVEEFLVTYSPSWRELFSERYVNPYLEAIAIDAPVIRCESGPMRTRLAFSRGKHLYLRERRWIVPAQEVFTELPLYIGKASLCRRIATSLLTWRGGPLVFVHGDDWVARFLGMWLSGDWSNFDLFVSALQILLSYKAFVEVLHEVTDLSPEDESELRSIAYLACKARVLWPWALDPNGDIVRRCSVRRCVGHVRSGKGDFVLHNCAINWAAVMCVLERSRRRFFGWSTFAKLAKAMLGWIAKPSAQRIAVDGFVACRTLFLEENDFRPWPCVSSVLRNWARPAYNPLEYPHNFRAVLVTRFRSLNQTLSYLPDCQYTDALLAARKAARTAGVDDPWGAEFSNRDIALWADRISSVYDQSAFLRS